MLGTRMVRAFARSDSGAFAVLFALMSVVLIAMAGAAVDYTMWMQARSAAQEAADAAALGASASSATTQTDVEKIARTMIDQRLARWPDVKLQSASYDAGTHRVTANVKGTLMPYFVQLVGVGALPVVASSTAERATNGELEVALVLDNTWSMSDSDGSGSTKILALKKAANTMLDILWKDDNEHIRVGLVPYAEYVNVGMGNRHASWMSVADDTSTTTTNPKTCETRTTKQVCTRGAAKTCTRYNDGVAETYDCTPQTCTDQTVSPYEYCTGGNTTTATNKWYGCALSRTKGTLRLSDAEPFTPYTGYMNSKRCMTEIVPLTNSQKTIRAGINAMIISRDGNKPATYIPSGMIWGINILSPTEPFAQGKAYDPENLEPRKALILMTDGDNTLRFNSNGTHSAFSGTAAQTTTQKTQTDTDTLSLCSYAKTNRIEVFTVSFGVLLPASDAMLQSCASDDKHYYSASNANELARAFENIADQLRVVRIVH